MSGRDGERLRSRGTDVSNLAIRGDLAAFYRLMAMRYLLMHYVAFLVFDWTLAYTQGAIYRALLVQTG